MFTWYIIYIGVSSNTTDKKYSLEMPDLQNIGWLRGLWITNIKIKLWR